MTLKEDWSLIEQLLLEEEQRNVTDPAALDERKRNLQRLDQLLSGIDKQYMTYRRRYGWLTAHPSVAYVKWAQDLLNQPHFAVLDLYSDPADETGRRKQIVVIDSHETILFEAVFTSFGVVSGPTNDVQPLAEGLNSLLDTLVERSLAMSDIRRVYTQILAIAEHCHMDMPALVGETLFEEFQSYFLPQHADYKTIFRGDETTALALLSERIGQPFDEQIVRSHSAKGRALALLQVLRAIAKGFVDPRARPTLLASDPSHYEEHGSDEEKKG